MALVRPEFGRDRVALAVRAAPGAKIHIAFTINTAGGNGNMQEVFGALGDGLTNARGVFTFNLKIGFPAHTPGTALLTISETSDGASQIVKRTYPYRVYG